MSWYVYNRMLIPDTAPHIEPDVTGLDEKLKRSSAILMRYTSNFDCGYETQWWYLIKDDMMEMSKLTTNIRNQVRKGLKNSTVRKINPDVYYHKLYEIFKSTMVKRPQHKHKDLENIFMNSITQSRGQLEIWGVFFNESDTLIAYAIAEVFESYVNYREAFFNKEYHKFNISNALFYSMNFYYLNELKMTYVYDGERSINHPTEIQDYLIRTFGFRKAYCRLNISYKNFFVSFIIYFLYPFRNIFLKLGNSLIAFRNLYSLLKQEEIRKSFLVK
jgi:hypothetical protein